MAERTVNDLNDPARRRVIDMAVYQAEAMLQALLSAAMKDVDGLDSLVTGIVPRLLELNGVVMSASSDEFEELKSLQHRLYGGWHHTIA